MACGSLPMIVSGKFHTVLRRQIGSEVACGSYAPCEVGFAARLKHPGCCSLSVTGYPGQRLNELSGPLAQVRVLTGQPDSPDTFSMGPSVPDNLSGFAHAPCLTLAVGLLEAEIAYWLPAASVV